MTTPTPLTTTDARQSWCCCAKATPYQKGFEDFAYGRVYANPYRPSTPRLEAYERGSQDARRAARVDEYASYYAAAWEAFEADSDGPEPLCFAEWLAQQCEVQS